MDNATVRKHKAALTRAKKVGPAKVVEVCTVALNDFEDNGYPDCWHLWQRSLEDAKMKLRYEAWTAPDYLRSLFPTNYERRNHGIDYGRLGRRFH